MKRAAEGGFGINGVANGKLFKMIKGTKQSADHVGGHPEYNAAVLGALGNISDKLTPKQIA